MARDWVGVVVALERAYGHIVAEVSSNHCKLAFILLLPMNRNLSEFMEITGTSRKTAAKYLEDANNNLNKAVGDFLGSKVNSKLMTIFNKYRDTNTSIGIDGTLQYLEDLGIEPEDVKALILSYFLESESMGSFRKDAFLRNWDGVGAVTVEDMAKYLQLLKAEMCHLSEFQKLYTFTFDFLLENSHQKSLPYDLVIDYWKLLFGLIELDDETRKRIDQWYEFLETVKKPINKDTYLMFWEFVKEVMMVDAKGMKEYDEMASWPVIIDEYIEYLQENGLLGEIEG